MSERAFGVVVLCWYSTMTVCSLAVNFRSVCFDLLMQAHYQELCEGSTVCVLYAAAFFM